MYSLKRIVVTTMLGLLFGAVAIWMTVGVGAKLPVEVIIRMLLNFGLMGFIIGISLIRWHWGINGLFFGLVLGALEGLAASTAALPVLIPLVYGLLAGFLIEFVSTKLLKAGIKYVPIYTS